MKATQACNAECPYFLEPEHLQPLADHYDLDLRGGGKTSKAYTGRKTMEHTISMLKELFTLKGFFPNFVSTDTDCPDNLCKYCIL